MTLHLSRSLEKLKEGVLTLGSIVQQRMDWAMTAFVELDETLAKKVIDGDRETDLNEVEIEEECLKLLALYQPVAMDLRLVVSILKINNDLERIGDLAVSICWQAIDLKKCSAQIDSFTINTMASQAKTMLKESLAAMLAQDTVRAHAVLTMDDLVDQENRRMSERCLSAMKKDSNSIDALHAQLTVARALECMADHATNIAEDVVYMVQGSIVRHGLVD